MRVLVPFDSVVCGERVFATLSHTGEVDPSRGGRTLLLVQSWDLYVNAAMEQHRGYLPEDPVWMEHPETGELAHESSSRSERLWVAFNVPPSDGAQTVQHTFRYEVRDSGPHVVLGRRHLTVLSLALASEVSVFWTDPVLHHWESMRLTSEGDPLDRVWMGCPVFSRQDWLAKFGPGVTFLPRHELLRRQRAREVFGDVGGHTGLPMHSAESPVAVVQREPHTGLRRGPRIMDL